MWVFWGFFGNKISLYDFFFPLINIAGNLNPIIMNWVNCHMPTMLLAPTFASTRLLKHFNNLIKHYRCDI